MRVALARFLHDCSGATALEYALIGSLISVAMALAAASVGSGLNGLISAISPHFD